MTHGPVPDLARPRRRKPPAEPALFLDDVQHLVLEGISWRFYENLLKEIGNRPIRITYDEGRMEIMSPLPEHESPAERIADLIKALTELRNVEIASFGSTTFRRVDLKKGFEPDKCFYLKHERKMRGRKRLNMLKDPPPDLIVEVDITSKSVAREPLYAAFGVPEIWRWDDKRLQCLWLIGNAYQVRAKSQAFAFLSPADLARFINLWGKLGENAVVRKFRDWVRKNGWAIESA